MVVETSPALNVFNTIQLETRSNETHVTQCNRVTVSGASDAEGPVHSVIPLMGSSLLRLCGNNRAWQAGEATVLSIRKSQASEDFTQLLRGLPELHAIDDPVYNHEVRSIQWFFIINKLVIN